MLKAVILIGGPLKGTRFRPLSFDMPKPLFPVAGLPMIQHHIEAFSLIPELKEIIIMGYYTAGELSQFVADMSEKYKVGIRYLQEFTPLGTGGGLYHFRDQIRSAVGTGYAPSRREIPLDDGLQRVDVLVKSKLGARTLEIGLSKGAPKFVPFFVTLLLTRQKSEYGNPEGFFIVNGDVCADFPLQDMLDHHKNRGEDALITIMATEANKQQAVNYGCVARHPSLGHMTHYVEKPSTFVSPLINCGVYFCSMGIFENLGNVFNQRLSFSDEDDQMKEKGLMQLEQDVLTPLAGSGRAFVYVTSRWWSQLKSAGAAIYANRHYLQLYRKTHPDRLSSVKNVVGDVHIHRTAVVHPTALIGPNVTIGAGVNIGPGVRLKDTIILDGASIGSHTLVLNSIVGRNVKIGSWSRVEGTPCDPNPDKPFAKMDNLPLFNKDGRLNPSITVLGCSVKVPSEVILLNSIVLPYKELTRSFKYEIIL